MKGIFLLRAIFVVLLLARFSACSGEESTGTPSNANKTAHSQHDDGVSVSEAQDQRSGGDASLTPSETIPDAQQADEQAAEAERIQREMLAAEVEEGPVKKTPLLFPPAWHDLSNLVAASAEALPSAASALDVSELPSLYEGAAAGDKDAAEAAARLQLIPAYGNVLYVPYRLDCSSSSVALEASGNSTEGVDSPEARQRKLCADAVLSASDFLRSVYGHRWNVSSSEPQVDMQVSSAVWLQLAYSHDAQHPSSVPKEVVPPVRFESGFPIQDDPIITQFVPQLGRGVVMLEAQAHAHYASPDISCDDSSNDIAVACVASHASGGGRTEASRHQLSVSFGFKGEAFVSSHSEVASDSNANGSSPSAGSKSDTIESVAVGTDGHVSPASGGRGLGGRKGATAHSGGSRRGAPWVSSLRLMSYNLWNSNPPRWLWRWAPDRLRQYGLRMLHLSDVIREVGPDVIGFQEVRYDSSLGGYDSELEGDPSAAAGAGKRFTDGIATARDWYNRTRFYSTLHRYAERNKPKWEAVTRSPQYGAYASGHPLEGPLDGEADVIRCLQRLRPAADANETATQLGSAASAESDGAALLDDVSDIALRQGWEEGAQRSNLYSQPRIGHPQSDVDRLLESLKATPHAQISHVSALLGAAYPYFAYQPAQLYVDRNSYGREPSRDEEGPAIFSKHPIVHSDYLLLSRDANDDGDGHQRLCLHAVIDVTGAVTGIAERSDSSGSSESENNSVDSERILIDVYSVHLALSEAARNRTVRELLAFISRSARGQLQVLVGDMNAEPHEPAMQALVTSAAQEQLQQQLTYARPVAAPALSERVDGAAASFSAAPGETLVDDRPIAAQTADVRLWSHRLTKPTEQGQRNGNSSSASSNGNHAAVALLHDVWASLYPEPQPGDKDAAIRRYGFTFPSDNPVKRIDLMLAGTPEGGNTCNRDQLPQRREDSAADAEIERAGDPGLLCIAVHRSYVIGQDPLPATEGGEGRGLGMTHEYSPIYASDHRGLVAHLSLQQQPRQQKG